MVGLISSEGCIQHGMVTDTNKNILVLEGIDRETSNRSFRTSNEGLSFDTFTIRTNIRLNSQHVSGRILDN